MKDLSSFIDALIAAHQDRGGFHPSGLTPSTIEEAYAVHEALMEALGPVEGFKISQKPNQPPVVAPIPKSRCLKSGAQVGVAQEVAVELEVGFIIVEPIPGPDDPEFLHRLLSAVRPAPMIELVGTRLEGPLASDPMVKLSDLQACEALIFGDADEAWAGSDIDAPNVRLDCDGQTVIEGRGKVPAGTALFALENTVKVLGDRFAGLQVGQKLLTGALITPLPMTAGRSIGGHIEGLGDVTCTL